MFYKSLSLCLLVAFVSIEYVHCYSFDDPEFNEILRSGFEEMKHLAEEEPRLRRNAGDHDDKFECKHRKFKQTCCGDENILKHFADKEKDSGKACFKNVSAKFDEINKAKTNQPSSYDMFSCEGVKNMKKKIYCVTECIGKKQGLLADDGTLNQEKIKALIQAEPLKEEWQRDLAMAGATECFKKVYPTTFPKEETSNGMLDCNPTYLQFLHCVNREIELGCPEQYQKNTKKCKDIRANMTKRKLADSKN